MAHFCLYKVRKPPTLLYWRRHGLQSYTDYTIQTGSTARWSLTRRIAHYTWPKSTPSCVMRQLSISFCLSPLSCQLDFPVNYRRPYQRHNSGLSGHKGDVNASYIHVCTSISGIPKGFSGYSLLRIQCWTRTSSRLG